jgi:hypothetical protein
MPFDWCKSVQVICNIVKDLGICAELLLSFFINIGRSGCSILLSFNSKITLPGIIILDKCVMYLKKESFRILFLNLF